jgi:dipeptidyl aminopeptidase/acylaminoacyl peptidase
MTTPSPRPITAEDALAFKQLADVQISPDGALVAFVLGDVCKEDTQAPRSQVWVVPAGGGAARPFTGGPRTDSEPRWSPDGRTLAFLSDRAEDSRPQVYLLERDGGEARRLTNLPGKISELAWSPDGARLAFLMEDPETEEEKRRKAAKDDPIEFEKNHKWQRVWTVEAASGEARQVTADGAQVWEFDWAPDGGFALVVGPEPYEWSWYVSRLARVGPDGGEPQTIYTVPEKQFACPRVSPDGASVAFLSAIWSDSGMNGGDIMLVPAGGGAARNLTTGYGGSVWWIEWAPDGATIDYMAYEDGEATIGRLDLATGARTTRWKAAAQINESFSARPLARANGSIAIARQDATHPADIWLATPTNDHRPPTTDQAGVEDRGWKIEDSNVGGDNKLSSILHPPSSATAVVDRRSSVVGLEWRQLTNLHPQATELALGETRVLRWRSADGLEIQGLLILPVGYQAGRRVPLITWIHGGPAWLYTQGFYGAGRVPHQMFAGAGFAVLLPNPRGSVGWGVPFTEANIGDLGGRDFEDIMAGVDHVIDLGIADAQRLGVGGWSYGGFMSAWAITQTDRFKAAMVGAAITNWRSFHGVASIGTWDQISYRANPYEQGGRYDQFSPIHYVHKVTTPTLIIHGENDTIVPVGQSYELFRALKDRSVPTELVVYPREPHGPLEQMHNLDRLRRYMEWFTQYLA